MLNPMQDRGGALAADPEQCEAEPIHIPGTIQPHGVLLALEGPSFRIVEASQSCEALLGKDAAELLDQDLEHAFGRDLAAGLREAADRYASLPSSPARFEWPSERLSRAFEAYVHRSGPLTVLELTPAPHPREDSGLLLREASQALRAVQAQADSVSKSSVAAQYVRRLTGYDRVMIYRFHEDWHGEVVAEDRRADLEPYLGLHYPASDIPSQARRLFLASPSRVIADVEYVPSPILVSERLAVPGALDLSQSVLRSVSPVHLEYLRNMEVGATLVASLAVGDRLLGLVSCQHTSPRQPSGAIRDILDRIAQDLATQLALEEEVRSRQYSTMLGNCQAALVRAMRHGARLRDLLRGTGLADLLGAVAADGVALISESELACGGATPDPADIRRIAAQLQEPRSAAPEGCIVTDCLSGLLPEMARLAGTASGMMMLPMDSKLPLRLMFFRGERLRTVTWAGDPDKRGAATAEGRLSPRRSFAAWSESVRHRSTPWRTEEIGAARALATTIDIEMRRVAEDGLRATETLLEEAMNSLSAHIAVLDQDGVIVTVNESWRRFAACNGGTGNCLPGVNYLSACTSALGTAEGGVAAAALLGIREVLAGTRDFLSLEYPCDSPTEARWFVMRVYRMTGTRAGAVVAHEEITGSKRAERDLLASEARFRTLSEDSSDGVWVVKDGRIVYANPAALALWGESDPAALLGQTILDRIHPEDRQTIVARIAALQGGGPPTPPRIIRLLRRDGTAIEIEGRGNLIQFDGGPAIGVVARDPSERRRAERVLRESEHRFRSVIASMEEGVVLADATGTFQLWNPATERILGLSGEQLAGRSSVDPRWRATDESGTELRNDQHFAMLALHTGKPAGGYIRVERGDGTWAWLQVNAVPLFHPGEPAAYAVTATFADVTQRRELERELVHKQAELEQLNRLLEERVASAVAELRSKDQLFIVQGRQAAMGEMIGNIAHQWRQPLNALGLVLANLEDARSVGALDSSAVTQAISSGTALVQRMSSTINDFRNFFRPGKEREAFQVRTQVEQAASLVEASFRHSHIEIRIAAVNDLWLFGFPNEYAQVLLNLLVNAKDAIQERGIAPGLITISASARESESVLTVLDNGGGFPAGVLDRVFDPYFSTRESGSGIGLYMCKMIIESMGGRIEARNRGPGAELVVSCPLAREIP